MISDNVMEGVAVRSEYAAQPTFRDEFGSKEVLKVDRGTSGTFPRTCIDVDTHNRTVV